MLSILLLFYLSSIILFHLPLKKLILKNNLTLDILFFIISNIILIIAIIIFYFYFKDLTFTTILNIFLLFNTLFYLKEIVPCNKNFIYYILPYFITNLIFLIYPILKYLNIP